MTSFPRYTQPQLRALQALPENGDWIVAKRDTGAALNSLQLYYPMLVEIQSSSRYAYRYCLTLAGREELKRLFPASVSEETS
jgi:hypothetical protein